MFDLGLAMQKKQEFESARLLDFEFRTRARAVRMLAESLGIDEVAAADIVATTPAPELPGRIALLAGMRADECLAEYENCLAIAYRQLLVERGDPTPHRLG